VFSASYLNVLRAAISPLPNLHNLFTRFAIIRHRTLEGFPTRKVVKLRAVIGEMVFGKISSYTPTSSDSGKVLSVFIPELCEQMGKQVNSYHFHIYLMLSCIV
jgi:hypothetical protein